MTIAIPVRDRPAECFQALARPLCLGRGDWRTARYRFGGLEVWARPLRSADSGSLYLYWVGALRPRQGGGSVGMRLLTDLADEAGLELTLHADPWGRGRMGRDALRSWYERFGFVATGDDLVPYWPGRLGLAMCRRPG